MTRQMRGSNEPLVVVLFPPVKSNSQTEKLQELKSFVLYNNQISCYNVYIHIEAAGWPHIFSDAVRPPQKGMPFGYNMSKRS